MTLHEAIRQVLEDKGKSMTAQEVVGEINKKDLYKKRNGEEISVYQVIQRVNQYPDLFTITVSLAENNRNV